MTTQIFDAYASYYDALYRDKDYEGECDVLEGAFKRWLPAGPYRILDAGCGTGNHAAVLARRGHRVLGIDRSPAMLARAREKLRETDDRLRLSLGDIRSLELQETFDAIVCLFAVLSYQLTTADVLASLRSFRRHLGTGGLLVCDFWNGAAVLTVGPSTKVKEASSDGKRVLRVANPVGNDLLAQTNETEYTVMVLEGGSVVAEVHETHRVRYFFPQEIRHYAEDCGFAVLDGPGSWDGGDLTATTWTGVLFARAE